MSIIVTIISNITVLQCYLNICVNKEAPPTHSVHWGLNPTSKTLAPSFLPGPFLNLQTIQIPLFMEFTAYVLLFHTPP